MFNKLLKNQKALYFLGGIVSAAVGAKLLKSKSCRDLCVKGLAQGMKLQKDAMETFQNMKEEAADMCYDAKNQDETIDETVAEAVE